ncbi:NAD-binding protein, partial [Cupriavidus pinatubonensis]|uniref:NAD-binding protein n=1 Tax=Cupriavidus pinatubonensis TaxID=248026 RepID=UPI0015E2FB43
MSQILTKLQPVRRPRPAIRLGRPRLLIVGCGDVGTRCLRILSARMRIFAVTSQPERRAELRAAGAVPLVANLDRPATLARLRGLASRVLDLAPPPGTGEGDPRTRALLATLRRTAWRRSRVHAGEPVILPDRQGTRPAFVYASTSGVYGDRAGARVAEFARVRPETARARRRVAAEQAVRKFGRSGGWRTML